MIIYGTSQLKKSLGKHFNIVAVLVVAT